MRAVDLILKKRDGGALTQDEIRFLINGYVDGSIPEYQVSSWLMSVFFKGMTFEETGYLTREMIDSGDVMDLSSLSGPLVDKHSTGGVGDKVSLILAPIAAACGLQIPMMSGRALGHTGGTLDKLESIPGFSVSMDSDRFRQALKEVGFGMIGQSKTVVPADRLMYALRDVTGTVESIPLITASIMSKKFAEGARSLVFDVKCGKGAFMKDFNQARALAESLVETGRSLNRRTVAVITSMEEPLGNMVGNFLEVEESVLCLQGKGPADLMEVTLRLTAWMLVAGGVAKSVEEALEMCNEKIENGQALDKFRENVIFQGGDWDALLDGLGTFRSRYTTALTAPSDGVITGIDAFTTGMAGVALGVGRNKTSDDVLPYVGMEFFHKTGTNVKKGDTICTIYGEEETRLNEAHEMMKQAVTIEASAKEAGTADTLIIEEMTAL